MTRVDGVPTAPEGHRLDRDGRHAGSRHLDREVVLVARLVGPLATLVVDAHDVVDAAAVAGHANHRRCRPPRFLRKQEIREHAHTGPAVEHDLLAAVPGEAPRLDRDRAERLAIRREAADELDQLRPERLLPRVGVAARARLESEAPRRGRVQVDRVCHGIESAVFKILLYSGQRPDVGGRRRRLRVEPHGAGGRHPGGQPREVATRKFGHESS